MKTKQNTMKITTLTSIILILIILASAGVLAAPAITFVNPANNAINIGVSPTPTISAVFNETMDAATMYMITSVMMRDQNGAAVSLSLNYNVATKTLYIYPFVMSLDYNSNYTIIITDVVKNLLGTSLAQNYTWSFRTPVLVTTITPALSSVTPADGAININAYAPGISASFNSDIMNTETMYALNSITLKDQNNNYVPVFAGSYDYVLKKISIDPWSTLDNDTLYTATITTGVKDLAGTPLAQNYSWTFRTALSSTLPQPPNTFVFNVTANPGGTISPSGIFYSTYLSFNTFIITPDSGYHVISVYVDGVNQGPRTALYNLISTHNTTIVANFAVNTPTNDITATAGPNGAINPSGVTTILFGGNQTYSWTANPGFVMSEVIVDGVIKAINNQTRNYTFTNVMDPHNIIVNFIPDTFYFNASVGLGGTITSSGSSAVPAFGSKQYVITPNADSFLDYILIDGVPTTATPILYYTPYVYNFMNVNANHTISATFSQRIFSITSIAGANGNITPKGTINVNRYASQTYTMTPAANYHVADVLVDGVSVGPVTSYTFTSVNATHTINATFAMNTLSITSSAGPDGAITPLGATPVIYNLNQLFTITPNPGFHVLDVQIDGFSVGPVPAYMFTFVTIPHTINAVFIANSFNITSSSSINGIITPSGIIEVTTGNNQTYNMTPDAGYSITDVLVDGVSVGQVAGYTFANVNATHTITATFADVVPPVITLLGRNPTSLAVGSVAYGDSGAIATDNVAGDLTASIITTSNVNTSLAGNYTVNYTVSDAAGNTATSTRIVQVLNQLDPLAIPKYSTPLVIPPQMPKTPNADPTIDYYEIAVREFKQHILPSGMPETTVWGYGSATTPGTFNYPAYTIEATANKPVRVKWINDLVDQNGNYLPHLLPVDQTLHWANPVGGMMGRDMAGMDPTPYIGPVPIVTHLHGSHVTQESDGFPEAWYLPAANNIPMDFAMTGTYYDLYQNSSPLGASWQPGSAVFEYPNDQRASTLWYHDHSMGMTRTNVYAGPAGFYLIRGGLDDQVFNALNNNTAALPGPAPGFGANVREIPLAIQDRSFLEDGSLFYPDSRMFFDGFTGPYAPVSDIAPIWNPEFFGNTMVVNGKTWPYLEVEPARYRLRLLDGTQGRFLILKFDNNMNFTQIGNEGGFLSQPAQLTQLLMGPAERADIIVDFTSVPVGTNITLQNIGPDSPYGGGVPGVDFIPADPSTTGQVMQFRVVSATTSDNSTPADQLTLPAITPLGAAQKVRKLSLNEVDSATLIDPIFGLPIGPKQALLGTVDIDNLTGMPFGIPMMWADPITENVTVNDTEIWELYDFTMDAHPMHLHLVTFEVINREIFDPMVGVPGTITQPEPWETGFKDTVIVYPGQLTRVKAKFDMTGLFVWHCHIIEHEDNEMMRPYQVLDAIADTIPPVITINGLNTVNITQGSVYADAGASALDAVDGIVAVVTAGTVDTSIVGAYTLNYTATDAANNTATSFRTVNVVAQPIQAYAVYNLTLKQGWNLISLPGQPYNTTSNTTFNYTAESFGVMAGADVVTMFNPATQLFASHIVGMPILNFNIAQGTSFFVHTTSNVSISINAVPFGNTTTQINIGWNPVGLAGAIAPTTADLIGTTIGGDVVSRFNPDTQQWQSHIVGMPILNFNINSTDGIFVHSTIASNWTR